MKMIVAYDGSETSRRALERAAELAGTESQIVVVSVATAVIGGARSAGVAEEGVLGRASGALGEAHAWLKAKGIVAEMVEAMGDPGHEIVEAAKRASADLVVVGSHDRNVLERLFLGSVSSDVIHHAPCDVLVVR
jgi:nucleotide-binding universal stress UspA family protein